MVVRVPVGHIQPGATLLNLPHPITYHPKGLVIKTSFISYTNYIFRHGTLVFHPFFSGTDNDTSYCQSANNRVIYRNASVARLDETKSQVIFWKKSIDEMRKLFMGQVKAVGECPLKFK